MARTRLSYWSKVVKRVLPFCLFAFLPLYVCAQEEPEYRLELGAGLGMVSYEGDFNGNLLRQPQAMGTLLAKYKKNPRMA